MLQDSAKPRRKTILLIDDDRGVRASISQALGKFDYELIEAATPDAAALIWSERQDTIDLILLDVLLPGLSGPELATEILSSHPKAPIIYITGVGKENLNRFRVPENARLLHKPFAISDLRTLVQSTLAEEAV